MFKNNKSLKNNKILINDTFYKKCKIHLKKAMILILSMLCIVFIGLGILVISYLGKINKIDIDKSNLSIKKDILERDNAILYNNNIKNIALFGIDETEGTIGRSDCIMIFTIDNKHKRLKLSSIIRDSYVTIPTKNKKDKINHAYAFGGPQLALKTLNENFNLKYR